MSIDRDHAARAASLTPAQGPAPRRGQPAQNQHPPRCAPRPCAVVVLDAGSDTDGSRSSRVASVEPVLSRWEALIHDRTGPAARPVCVVAHDAMRLSAGLRGLPAEIGRFLVIRPNRAHCAAGEDSGLPVVTVAAMAAVAVTAALLGTLRRRGMQPRQTRVLIAGSATMPVLCPLLAAAGVGELTSWDRRDAGRFPLRGITRDVEVVIDLLGCGRDLTDAARGRSGLIIITPDTTSWALLALPGMLHALATAHDPRLDVALYYACALALGKASPPGRVLPDPTDPELGPAIEQAATHALRGGARSRREQTQAPPTTGWNRPR